MGRKISCFFLFFGVVWSEDAVSLPITWVELMFIPFDWSDVDIHFCKGKYGFIYHFLSVLAKNHVWHTGEQLDSVPIWSVHTGSLKTLHANHPKIKPCQGQDARVACAVWRLGSWDPDHLTQCRNNSQPFSSQITLHLHHSVFFFTPSAQQKKGTGTQTGADIYIQ